MSWASMVLDLLFGGVLVFVPAARGVSLVLLGLFHVGNSLLFDIGTFPYLMLASTIVWLPESRFLAGVCSLCTGIERAVLLDEAAPKPPAAKKAPPSLRDTCQVAKYSKALQLALLLFVVSAAEALCLVRRRCELDQCTWRVCPPCSIDACDSQRMKQQGHRFSWRMMLNQEVPSSWHHRGIIVREVSDAEQVCRCRTCSFAGSAPRWRARPSYRPRVPTNAIYGSKLTNASRCGSTLTASYASRTST